ncbi:MAG: glycoside hydrolase family 3 protein, partial [Bdellovibrionales bacterium]|nr:glycoside hydrolase family 3 protein [Bdellovibrionales bacterium]
MLSSAGKECGIVWSDMGYDSGIHVLVGLQSPRLEGKALDVLKALRPAGVILRKEALLSGASYETWLDSLDELLSDVKKAIGRAKVLVAVDHEGGRVNRFPPPVTQFPYPIFFREHARAVGQAMGKELRSFGVNFVLSPVADIHTNPNNPVIGPRAFGRNAKEASRFDASFLKGIQESG